MGEEAGRLYTYRYTVATSNESHLNISLSVRDKVAGQGPQTITSEEKGKPKADCPSAYQPNVLPLGQTGSQTTVGWLSVALRSHKP